MNAQTNSNKQARLELECSIIGACLIEDCYGHIGKYLQPGNFASKSHQVIWQAIQDLWPDKPIDLRSVHHQLISKYGQQLAYHLASCTAYINSSANLEYHALCLVQLDIQTKVLRAIEQTKWHPADGSIRQASQEVWMEMNEAKDILGTLADAACYLTEVETDHPITKQIVGYNQAVAAKASEIKSNYPARRLLTALEGLGQTGDRMRQIAFKKVSDLLLTIINSPTVSPQVVEGLVSTSKAFSK